MNDQAGHGLCLAPDWQAVAGAEGPYESTGPGSQVYALVLRAGYTRWFYVLACRARLLALS